MLSIRQTLVENALCLKRPMKMRLNDICIFREQHHLLIGLVFALDYFAFVDEIKGQINDKLFH